MMGGVSTDIHGATPMAGLYAAGEVACVSINGANRLGSNSLPECLVFGARAGRAAAEFASAQKAPNGSVLGQATDELVRLEKQYLFKDVYKRQILTNIGTSLIEPRVFYLQWTIRTAACKL